MTAAPHSPLLERVARSICKASGFNPDEPDEHTPAWRDFVEEAQAALDACHAEEVREALSLLCEAKALKESNGDFPAYREVKEMGWAKAHAVLAKLDGRS